MAKRQYRDVTVIGASAGGVEALREIVRGLPKDYRATVFVVLHVAPQSPSVLHRLLDHVSQMPTRQAEDGLMFEPGQIWVAPPDRHLVVEQHRMRIAQGPRENRHRPSIDVLFRSAAVAFGPRATGVILTGMLDDGAAGLWAIKERGGTAVVQDPDEALYPQMPASALELVDADHVLPLADIAPRLIGLAREPVVPVARAPAPGLEMEVKMASENSSTMEQLDALGERSTVTCPECGGALWEMQDPTSRFRCHVGHAYTMRSLVSAQSERVESALWAGLRSLEESETLSRRLADSASRRGHGHSAQEFLQRAREDQGHAEVLRTMLKQLPAMESLSSDTAAGEASAAEGTA